MGELQTSTTDEKAFLRLAVAAIPRVSELILGYAPEDQAGALEVAERSFVAAALDYGCTDITAQSSRVCNNAAATRSISETASKRKEVERPA